MKLSILGGTGGVGRHLVRLALERGHDVSMLVRPATHATPPDGARVVRGELSDSAELDDTMCDADAVLSCIGMQRKHPANPWSRSLSPKDLTSSTASLIVDAMRRQSVPRIIAVSAAGVGDSAARLNMMMRFLLATTMIGDAYADLAKMEQVYAQSGLEWLAPRPTRLTDGRHAKGIDTVESFGSLDAISRRDVASWMLDALEHPSWPLDAWGTRTPQISAA